VDIFAKDQCPTWRQEVSAETQVRKGTTAPEQPDNEGTGNSHQISKIKKITGPRRCYESERSEDKGRWKNNPPKNNEYVRDKE
jgi:hypothetical protein